MPRLLFCTVLASCLVLAQPVHQQPAFEVASVKLSPPFVNGGSLRVGTFGGPAKGDPGQISFSYMTLARQITVAYGIEQFQLTGPEWINTSRFDITAKLPAGATDGQVPSMLQNLLADRLKLRVHRESRPTTVYELTVADGGPKLKAASDKSASSEGLSGQPRLNSGGFPEIPPGKNGSVTVDGRARWQTVNSKLEELVSMLARELHATVTDATGLDGRYDISLFWVSAGTTADPDISGDSPSGPMLVAALKGQLGLRLVSKKGLGGVLVVDSAEKVPTEN